MGWRFQGKWPCNRLEPDHRKEPEGTRSVQRKCTKLYAAPALLLLSNSIDMGGGGQGATETADKALCPRGPCGRGFECVRDLDVTQDPHPAPSADLPLRLPWRHGLAYSKCCQLPRPRKLQACAQHSSHAASRTSSALAQGLPETLSGSLPHRSLGTQAPNHLP